MYSWYTVAVYGTYRHGAVLLIAGNSMNSIQYLRIVLGDPIDHRYTDSPRSNRAEILQKMF